MKQFAWCLALVLPGAAAVAADPKESFDWPQWQGPDRNAVSKEKGLLKEWPKDGPPLAWKANGHRRGDGRHRRQPGPDLHHRRQRRARPGSTPSTSRTASTSGRRRSGAGGNSGNMFQPSGPRATPTVDGDRIYILSQHGDLVCFTTDGKEVWRTDYVKDFGGIMPVWGFSESPLVDGDRLVCTPGTEDGTLMALDKKTGKPIWKCKVPEGPDGRPGLPRHVRGGLRLGHRGRLRGRAAVRAAHGDDARRGRGDRRQAAVAVRPGLQHAPDQLLHAGLPRRHGVRRLVLRRGRGRGEAEQGRQGRDHGQGGVLQPQAEEPPRRHGPGGRLPVRLASTRGS